MAGPCMTDTDCIVSSQNPDGTVQWDIRLGANTGLECNNLISGNQGLGINRLGTLGPTGSPPSNLYDDTIRVSANNELYAAVPNAAYTSQSNADHNGIPLTGAWSSDNLNFTITNPYNAQLLGLITGKFVVNYTVNVTRTTLTLAYDGSAPRDANGDMYSAQVIANVLMNNVDVVEQQFAISGDLRRAQGTGNINLKEFEHFHRWFTWNPGETKNFRVRAKLEDTQELSDNIDVANGDNGIRSQVQVVAFPFNTRTF